MSKVLRLMMVVAMAAMVPATAGAALIWDTTVGTAAPPTTLGVYTMVGFGDDLRAQFSAVTDVPSPLGGDVDFSISMSLRTVGSGWATWSHGYTGDVYFTQGATSVTLTLPEGTGAFYFYAEPDPFSPPFLITATAAGGGGVTQSVSGSSGATFFGIHGTAFESITTIVIESPGVFGEPGASFAVGEFGIAAVPEPSSLTLLTLGALSLGARRFRRKGGA